MCGIRDGRPGHTGLLAAGLGGLLAFGAGRSRPGIPRGADRPHLPPPPEILMARRQDPEPHNSPFGGMPRAGGRGTLLHPFNGCLPDTYYAHCASDDCQCGLPLPPNTGVGDAMDTAMRCRRLRGVEASYPASLLCMPGPPRQGRIGDAGCASRFSAALAEVLQGRSWSRAFALAGLHDGPPLSERFRIALGEPALALDAVAPPSLAELQCIFPARRTIPLHLLFQSLLRPMPVRAAMAPGHLRPRGVRGSGRDRPAGLWAGRLRSSADAVRAPSAAAPAPAADPRPPAPRPPIGHRLGAWRRPRPTGRPA